MKRHLYLFFIFYVFSLSLFGQETSAQAMNRARTFGPEWNTLVDMQKNLTGEARIRLDNYMMGFAHAAYILTQIFSNAGYSEFYSDTNFFFEQYETLVTRVGVYTINFRDNYYNAGINRTRFGGPRLGIIDFR